MITHDRSTFNDRVAGNGRTPAENSAYARIASAGISRDQQLANAERARTGRRAKARERVLAGQPHLSGAVLEREVDRDIGRQMDIARAASLTARRRARQAAEKLAAAEAVLEAAETENLGLDATGLLDAGND